jgi:hypothetical protein
MQIFDSTSYMKFGDSNEYYPKRSTKLFKTKMNHFHAATVGGNQHIFLYISRGKAAAAINSYRA